MRRFRLRPLKPAPVSDGHYAVRWRTVCTAGREGPLPVHARGALLPSYYHVDLVLGPYDSHEKAKVVAAAMDTGERERDCFWGWSEHSKPTFPRTDTMRDARNPSFIMCGPWDQRHPMIRVAEMMARSGQPVVVSR